MIRRNPPFVGNNNQNDSQREDILSVIGKSGKVLDYVCGWYFKAAEYIYGTDIHVAFVSTNSVTQGEQVASLWRRLFDHFKIHFDFAYRTFRWDSEANIKAHVHCVIVGFSSGQEEPRKKLFEDNRVKLVSNINPYLMDAPNVFIDRRKHPLCDVPEIRKGNQPTDGGHLIIEADEIETFLKQEPLARPYVKKLIGAREYINRKPRYCLWLVGVSPSELRKMPLVMERVKEVREMRLNSPDAGTRRLADTPTVFRETNNPSSYVVVPSVSSERRRYVPMGFMMDDTIATNLVLIIPEGTLYHFGILTSNVHMAWMRAVCGRLKSDYRYSKDIVYNNFPWPSPTPDQREKIEQTAQAILDARALYPDSSLADLYDELTMPPELRRAHQNNDRAVMAAYGFPVKGFTEADCVAELMKLYQKMVEN